MDREGRQLKSKAESVSLRYLFKILRSVWSIERVVISTLDRKPFVFNFVDIKT
jgi:hypothetical protein